MDGWNCATRFPRQRMSGERRCGRPRRSPSCCACTRWAAAGAQQRPETTNLLWICLTCPRREYGVGSVGYIHRRLVYGSAAADLLALPLDGLVMVEAHATGGMLVLGAAVRRCRRLRQLAAQRRRDPSV